MLYEVEAKCGHVGRDWYVIKTFAVVANSGKEAAEIARNNPRVKHHHKDAIRQVTVIDTVRFQEIKEMNRADPYFSCHSIQEQRATCHDIVLLPEKKTETCKRTENNRNAVYLKKEKIRNPRKYINNYYYEEDYVS